MPCGPFVAQDIDGSCVAAMLSLFFFVLARAVSAHWVEVDPPAIHPSKYTDIVIPFETLLLETVHLETMSSCPVTRVLQKTVVRENDTLFVTYGMGKLEETWCFSEYFEESSSTDSEVDVRSVDVRLEVVPVLGGKVTVLSLVKAPSAIKWTKGETEVSIEAVMMRGRRGLTHGCTVGQTLRKDLLNLCPDLEQVIATLDFNSLEPIVAPAHATPSSYVVQPEYQNMRASVTIIRETNRE